MCRPGQGVASRPSWQARRHSDTQARRHRHADRRVSRQAVSAYAGERKARTQASGKQVVGRTGRQGRQSWQVSTILFIFLHHFDDRVCQKRAVHRVEVDKEDDEGCLRLVLQMGAAVDDGLTLKHVSAVNAERKFVTSVTQNSPSMTFCVYSLANIYFFPTGRPVWSRARVWP